MISINATLLLQIIHFLVLMFILNHLMFKPILNLINERKEYTKNIKKKINSIELETEKLRQEFVLKEQDARKEASQERSEFKGQGIETVSEMIEVSREQVSAIKAQADKDVEEEIKRVQPLLRSEAEALSEEIAESVIGRRIAV